MNRPADNVRRRSAALGAAVALTGALAGAVALTPSVSAVAASRPAPATSAHRLGLQTLSLPGATAPADVRLVTGQQVKLTRTPNGRYAVTQLGSPRVQPGENGVARLFIQARTAPGASAPTITAIPTYAGPLVAGGAVDVHLFDVGYLAAHGYASGAVPVVVRYSASRPAAVVASAAEALPGSQYVPGSATGDTATVRVDPTHAADFWAALTRTPKADPDTRSGKVWFHNPNAPQRLAAGIAALSLRGAPAVSKPAITPATYTLTVRIHAFTDRSKWLFSNDAFDWEYGYLLGVTGADAGIPLDPTDLECNQQYTCDTLIATFRAPAGVYSFGSGQIVWQDGRFGELISYRPQVDLTRDTTITLSADTSTYTSLATSRPSEAEYDAATAVRDLPDGTKLSDLLGLGAVNYEYAAGAYVIPSPTVSVGAYHFELDLISEQPLIRMHVTGTDDPPALSPQYQEGTGESDELFGQDAKFPYYRFPTGTRTYPVVDVGMGSKQAFSGRNLTGKLALFRIDPDVRPYPCAANEGPLRRALAAGAAGVIIDPTNQTLDNPSGCLTPLTGTWTYYPKKLTEPDIPWVTVQAAQAQALEAMLRQHPVTVSVTGVGTPAYIYENNPNFEGRMPTSAGQTMTAANSITHVSAIHSTGPAVPVLTPTGTRPDDNALYAPEFGIWRTDGTPYTLTEYVGPKAPDYYYSYSWEDELATTFFDYEQLRMDGSAPARTDYNDQPQSYGAPHLNARTQRIVPLLGVAYCSFCRQGNVLYPLVASVSGGAPQVISTSGFFPDATLTRNGVAIPMNGGIPSYTLPAKAGDYVFTNRGASSDVTWRFSSAAPTKTTNPIGTICVGTLVGTSDDPCAAAPLVFARFDAPVDLDNEATAGTTQTVQVTGYHQDPSAAPITSMTVSVSVDGGSTWTAATMTHESGATWSASFPVPPLARTNGYVSLRVHAADADGNSIAQTLDDSYGLRN